MEKVTFRCKRSGNTVSFSNPDDIDGLRKHEGYEEIINTPDFLSAPSEQPRKRGPKPKFQIDPDIVSTIE